MAAAARRARLEESWAWIESELDDYDAEPEPGTSAAGSMALEPLYDAVDSIVGRNPTLQLRRPALTKMVTTLVEKVGDNPTESAILGATTHIEATLVQAHRIGVADKTPTARQSFSSNDGSRRLMPQRSGTPTGISASLRSMPSFTGTDRSATPDGAALSELDPGSPVTPAADSPRSPSAAFAADPLCDINFDGLAASDDELVSHCCTMAEKLGMQDALGVGPEKIEEYFLSCRNQMHSYCPFHNWHHVADVTQCLYTVILTTGLNKALTIEQLIAVFLAAPAHDLDHRGRSNVLEINEETDIAKEFPDEKGPLENHHARLALQTYATHNTTKLTSAAASPTHCHPLVCGSLDGSAVALAVARDGGRPDVCTCVALCCFALHAEQTRGHEDSREFDGEPAACGPRLCEEWYPRYGHGPARSHHEWFQGVDVSHTTTPDRLTQPACCLACLLAALLLLSLSANLDDGNCRLPRQSASRSRYAFVSDDALCSALPRPSLPCVALRCSAVPTCRTRRIRCVRRTSSSPGRRAG
jgi:hypothetical protein